MDEVVKLIPFRITGLHFDHVDDLLEYKNAKVYIGRREWEGALSAAPNWAHGKILHEFSNTPDCKKRLVLVDDEEIAPGIRVVQLGCHTPGSQGVLVRTWMGPVPLAGDVVYKYENIEKDSPTRSPDPQICRDAMARIRSLADIVLPAHDPLTLERWPNGIIGALPASCSRKVKSLILTH